MTAKKAEKRPAKPARLDLYLPRETKATLVARAGEETVRRQRRVSVNALVVEWITEKLGQKR